MPRHSVFWTLTLLVIVGVGYLIADFFSAAPATPNGSALSPAPSIVNRYGNTTAIRSSKSLTLDKKNNIKQEVANDEPTPAVNMTEKEALETQFQALRDEQRRQWQEIFGEDREKMRAVIRAAIDNNLEFSEMFRRSREIRDNWATSNDSDKPQMLAELTALRQKGFEVIKAELEELNNSPAPLVDSNSTTPVDQTPATPSESSPANEPERPKEPEVIM